MINFTVGPVQTNESIRKLGSNQVPYFRTDEFSKLMLENEEMMKNMLNAPDNSKVLFVTGSGTASMEASIINTLTKEDKALIVNGGSFGQRFVELCEIYEIPHTTIHLNKGAQITENDLDIYNNKGYTTFIVNMHETSTGVLYDMELIKKFCQKNNLFLIVDAISSFLADKLDMSDLGIDIVITGSQKAIACPPGISIICLSEKAVTRVNNSDKKCMYLDLKSALDNARRGQTPFTPAVGILIQINERFKQIELNGGVEQETKKIAAIANDFRNKIKKLPFEVYSKYPSNAVTTLHPLNTSAYEIFKKLKDEYGIWVCPNGGDLKDEVFRVGHIGDLTIEENDTLIAALNDLKEKSFL